MPVAPAGNEMRSSEDARLAAVRELCSFERRLAGTDAERRAANRLAHRLREIGRRAEIEPIYVHPQAPLIWGTHLALAFAGSLVAVVEPVAGFALVLFAATSLYLDLNARLHLLRLLFFRRGSQNVVSPGTRPDAPARLLLVAHLDVARSAALFDPRQLRRLQAVGRFLPFPPTRILFWSVGALLPLLGARMAGVESNAISLLQLPPTLILLLATFAFADWQLSNPVPGANDNASGVAVALSIAEALERDPVDDLDVWVLLTGGEECGLEGMRSFARAHRKSLDAATTFAVVVDSVGAGDIRFVASEGMTVSFAMDGRLLELCAAVAEADAERAGDYGAAPLRHGFVTDALAAQTHGIRATAITCLEPEAILPTGMHTHDDVPDALDPAALDRAHRFTLELIRALDRDVARTASRAGNGSGR